MRFTDYTDRYIEDILPLHKPATQVTFKSHLRLLCSGFGDAEIDALNPRTVQKFFTVLKSQFAPKSVRNIWGTFRVVLAQARSDGLVIKLPEPKLPKVLRTPQAWLSVDQMRDVLGRAEGVEKVFLSTLCETGLRIGEAIALQPSDVDLKAKTLSVRHSVFNGVLQAPKTNGSIRTLSLSDQLTELLRDRVKCNTYLFQTRSGRPVWVGEALKDFHAILRGLHIKTCGFHSLRRASITALSNLGMPLPVLAYRVGHAAQGMTLGVYYQVDPKNLQDRPWVEEYAKLLY